MGQPEFLLSSKKDAYQECTPPEYRRCHRPPQGTDRLGLRRQIHSLVRSIKRLARSYKPLLNCCIRSCVDFRKYDDHGRLDWNTNQYSAIDRFADHRCGDALAAYICTQQPISFSPPEFVYDINTHALKSRQQMKRKEGGGAGRNEEVNLQITQLQSRTPPRRGGQAFSVD
jgi:hypothetical protein